MWSRAGLRSGPAGQLPGTQTSKTALRRHWNNRKYGPCTHRLPHAEEFLRELSAILASARPVLGRKSLKNIGTKGRQIFGLPRASTSNTSDASTTSSYSNSISEGYFGSPFRPAAAPQIRSSLFRFRSATFRRATITPRERVLTAPVPKKKFLPLKTRTINDLETWGSVYRVTLRHIPEEENPLNIACLSMLIMDTGSYCMQNSIVYHF